MIYDTKGWRINSFGLSDRRLHAEMQSSCPKTVRGLQDWQLSQRKSNNRVRAVKTPEQQESFRNNALAESTLFRIECETRSVSGHAPNANRNPDSGFHPDG